MSKPIILHLREVDRSVVALVGGKAASLGEMPSSGLLTPEGFVVTIIAYEVFVSKNRIDEIIKRALRERPIDSGVIGSVSALGSTMHLGALIALLLG